MNKIAKFTSEISNNDRLKYAEISGDYNPMHVDDAYASKTEFKKCILHGAYSAGLFSQMAGMHIPGRECLLHSINMKFKKPIYTPTKIEVEGRVIEDDGEAGTVQVTIKDYLSSEVYVEGSYKYGRHSETDSNVIQVEDTSPVLEKALSGILITGASGGLGVALKNNIGSNVIGISRQDKSGLLQINDLELINEIQDFNNIDAIIHCAWPKPLNQKLTESSNLKQLVDFHLSKPLRECLSLAKLIKEKGAPGAKLILIGSSFADAGRHAWSMPLYSLSKSLIPTLVKILALELAPTNHQVIGISFDILDGGMNSVMTKAARIANQDRTASGNMPDMNEAAENINWIIKNSGKLVSGAMIDLSGGAIP